MENSIFAYSNLYLSFISIEKSNYGKIILFFQENEEGIRSLSIKEFEEIILDFCDALFEAGQYERYIKFSLEILPISLEYGAPEHLYPKILFRRAASFYNVGLIWEAENILVQLCSIDTKQKEVRLLLKKCIQNRRKGLVQKNRAIAILLILLTALLSSGEVLFIRPFYEQYTTNFVIARYLLIGLAIILVSFGFLFEYFTIRRQIEKLILKK